MTLQEALNSLNPQQLSAVNYDGGPCLFVDATVSTFIYIVIYVAYFVIPEYLTRKTLGKKMMGLTVVLSKK